MRRIRKKKKGRVITGSLTKKQTGHSEAKNNAIGHRRYRTTKKKTEKDLKHFFYTKIDFSFVTAIVVSEKCFRSRATELGIKSMCTPTKQKKVIHTSCLSLVQPFHFLSLFSFFSAVVPKKISYIPDIRYGKSRPSG